MKKASITKKILVLLSWIASIHEDFVDGLVAMRRLRREEQRYDIDALYQRIADRKEE